MGCSIKHSCGIEYSKYTDTNPNPNKYVFNILSEQQIGNYLVVLVNYPNCTTFNGDKILVFKNKTTVKGILELDPHFLESQPDLIARFPSTKEGAEYAVMFVNNLNKL